MRVFSTLMSWSNENKSCLRVDESYEARILMRVFYFVNSVKYFFSYLHGFVAKNVKGTFALISFVKQEGIGGLERTI